MRSDPKSACSRMADLTRLGDQLALVEARLTVQRRVLDRTAATPAITGHEVARAGVIAMLVLAAVLLLLI